MRGLAISGDEGKGYCHDHGGTDQDLILGDISNDCSSDAGGQNK